MDYENTSNGMVMPVAPMYGGAGYGNNGGFGFGGDWAWVILLLVLFGGNGWGMGGIGGGMWPMMMGGMAGGWELYPWLNNSEHISDGFRDAQLHDSVTSVRDGINGLSTQLCNCCGDMQMALANSTAGIQQSLCSGFAGTTAAITGAQNAISQQLYSNEIASLNRSFAEQTANTAGFTGVQSSLCDIRYGNAQNTRDIIESQSRGIQTILDKLCALELDGYKRENDQLRTQLNMANLAASQTAQTAELRQSGATQLNQLVAELRSCPIPSQPVAGNTPLFACNPSFNSGNCGCGCNGNGFGFAA